MAFSEHSVHKHAFISPLAVAGELSDTFLDVFLYSSIEILMSSTKLSSLDVCVCVFVSVCVCALWKAIKEE